MRSVFPNVSFCQRVCILCTVAVTCLFAPAQFAAPQPAAKTHQPAGASAAVAGRMFDTPQQAADALVAAAEKFDVPTLTEIFGPDGNEIVLSGEFAQDRKHAADFAAEAREKKSISVDSRIGTRAFLLVGNEDWPFPVPLVKAGAKWYFDSKAGRQEFRYRRIGANELDAIDICRGYVEAQHEYGMQQREVTM